VRAIAAGGEDALREAAPSVGDTVRTRVVAGADHGWWGHERELGDIAAEFFARHLVAQGAK